MYQYIKHTCQATLKPILEEELESRMHIAHFESLQEFIKKKKSSNIVEDTARKITATLDGQSHIYQIIGYNDDYDPYLSALASSGMHTVRAEIEILVPEGSQNPYQGKMPTILRAL